MKFRVEVVCINDEGTEQRHDVMEMERRELAMETLGLSLAEGKTLLSTVQDFVASQQVNGCPVVRAPAFPQRPPGTVAQDQR